MSVPTRKFMNFPRKMPKNQFFLVFPKLWLILSPFLRNFKMKLKSIHLLTNLPNFRKTIKNRIEVF